MSSYLQIIDKLRKGNHKDLINKLSKDDYDLIFIGTEKGKEGIFTQIKEAIIDCKTLEIEIPLIGRLDISSAKIKQSIRKYKNSIKFKKDLILKLEDINERKRLLIFKKENDSTELKQNIKDLKLELEKDERDIAKLKKEIPEEIQVIKNRIKLWIHRYDIYNLDSVVTAKAGGKKLSTIEMKEKLYIDPVNKEIIESLLSDSDLTIEKFIFEFKRLKCPMTESVFLIAYQITNGIYTSTRKKELMNKVTKEEFKKLLEKENIFVDSL